MNETNHPSSLATCTLIQDFLGVKDGGIYEAVVKQKQQLDAVVAENVALKESVSEVRRQAFCGRRNSHNCGPFQHSDLCESIIESTKVETPSTDAALAEVEAKAALPANWDDLLFNEMNRRFELKRHDDDYLTNGDTQIGVEFAIEFIKQLREGLV